MEWINVYYINMGVTALTFFIGPTIHHKKLPNLLNWMIISFIWPLTWVGVIHLKRTGELDKIIKNINYHKEALKT